MKKIILSMAMLAMVGATATAQENNDGLTPSRPLTSGELFQGMSRSIPNGTCRTAIWSGRYLRQDRASYLSFCYSLCRLRFTEYHRREGGGCRERTACKGFGEGL